jgi:hypothetical protein
MSTLYLVVYKDYNDHNLIFDIQVLIKLGIDKGKDNDFINPYNFTQFIKDYIYEQTNRYNVTILNIINLNKLI